MPFAHKALIAGQIRYSQPFIDADLVTARHITTASHDEILKCVCGSFVVSSKREKTAISWPEFVDAAAAILRQEGTAASALSLPCIFHAQMRQNQPVLLMKCNGAAIQKLRKALMQSVLKRIDIIRIKVNRIRHRMAAFAASVAGGAADFRHIRGVIEFLIHVIFSCAIYLFLHLPMGQTSLTEQHIKSVSSSPPAMLPLFKSRKDTLLPLIAFAFQVFFSLTDP